jgi:hypothetical protein
MIAAWRDGQVADCRRADHGARRDVQQQILELLDKLRREMEPGTCSSLRT